MGGAADLIVAITGLISAIAAPTLTIWLTQRSSRAERHRAAELAAQKTVTAATATATDEITRQMLQQLIEQALKYGEGGEPK